MNKDTWVAKTSVDSAPTFRSAIIPLLNEYDLLDAGTIAADRESATKAVRAAYQAAMNAASEVQPYFDLEQGFALPSSTHSIDEARDAIYQLITKFDPDTAEEVAKGFKEDLKKVCDQFAEHYKPKGGHALGGSDARSRSARRPSGNDE